MSLRIIHDEARREWQLQRAEAARKGKPFPPPGDRAHPIYWPFLIVWFLILFGLAAAALRWLFDQLAVGWEQLPAIMKSSNVRLVAAGLVLVLGACFYWLRKNYGFVYAALELGSSFGTAYAACAKFEGDTNRVGWLVAFLGSLYIAVRGYDNLDKWLKSRKRESRPCVQAIQEVHT